MIDEWMLKVLINSYTCCPNMESELGVGLLPRIIVCFKNNSYLCTWLLVSIHAVEANTIFTIH